MHQSWLPIIVSVNSQPTTIRRYSLVRTSGPSPAGGLRRLSLVRDLAPRGVPACEATERLAGTAAT
jgi:hypothetical protein